MHADLSHDTPAINQTSYGHLMMAAMASFLDAKAVGGTSTGLAHLKLAEDFAYSAKSATDDDEEKILAMRVLLSIRQTRLI